MDFYRQKNIISSHSCAFRPKVFDIIRKRYIFAADINNILNEYIMIVTTTPTIEGHPIREYKGLVTGETIIGANFVKDFFAGIRDIVGGRSSSYARC